MPDITLLPMIHLGEKGYYDEIKHEMWCHNKAFLEGCYVPTKRSLHLFHRLIGFFSGLSLQSGKISFFRKWKKEEKTSGKNSLQESVRVFGCNCGSCYYEELRLVRADLHRWHFLKVFRSMPWWSKLSYPFLIVAALLAAPFLNLRKYEFSEEDDADSEEEDWLDRFFKPFFKFTRTDRDLFLRTVLAEEIIRDCNQGKKLCVKYGERHMLPLAETLLADFDYKLARQRNVLAVAKHRSMDLSNLKTGYGQAHKQFWAKIRSKPRLEPLIQTVPAKETAYSNQTSKAGISSIAYQNTPKVAGWS